METVLYEALHQSINQSKHSSQKLKDADGGHNRNCSWRIYLFGDYLQIVKALRTKKAGVVSAFMFVILCNGIGLWTVYGVIKQD